MRDEKNLSPSHEMSPISEEHRSPPSLDRAVQGRLGDHLRAFYDELMQEAVPDRFHDLIERLSSDTTSR